MGEKPVGSLAGIGDVLGKKLEERGFDKVWGGCVQLGRAEDGLLGSFLAVGAGGE